MLAATWKLPFVTQCNHSAFPKQYSFPVSFEERTFLVFHVHESLMLHESLHGSSPVTDILTFSRKRKWPVPVTVPTPNRGWR